MGEVYAKVTRSSHIYKMSSKIVSYSSPPEVITTTTPAPQAGSVNFTNSVNGYTLPQWKDIIRNGGNATTICSGVFTDVWTTFLSAGNDYMYRHPSSNPYYRTGKKSELWGIPPIATTIPPAASIPADMIARVSNRAIVKFLRSVQAVRSSTMGGETLGEWKETVHALTSPLSSLRRHTLGYFDRVKKISIKHKVAHASGLSKALSDTYLEWTFGWNPLVSSIAEAYVGMKEFLNRYEVYPIEGHASENGAPTILKYSVSVDSGCVVEYVEKRTPRFSVRIKGAMRRESPARGPSGRFEALRLAPQDFIPTIWELLPYTFVVDYFTNIGEMIEAASLLTTDYVWTCRTQRAENIWTYNPIRTVPIVVPQGAITMWNKNWLHGGQITLNTTSWSRQPVQSVDLLPSFTVSLPLRAKPWANMAALLISNQRHLYSRLVR
jgi:hypothetical protein